MVKTAATIDKLISKDNKENKPIYNYVFNPTTELGTNCIKKWGKYFTTNTKFLKESQRQTVLILFSFES